MIRAVIFDMDGTMVDTETMWGQVSHDLAERYGIKFDAAVRVRMMGRNDRDSLSAFKEYFQLDTDLDELIRIRRQMVLADARLVKMNPGLPELLDLLDRLRIKKVVATSSFREFAQKTLALFDLAGRFDGLVTGDDIKISKPDPEIFLAAARRVSVPPAECLVLEDAQNGVEAARAAGMRVFAIPHDESRHHDFSKADKVLGSMREIDEALLRSL